MEMAVVCEGLEFPEGPVAMADGSVIVVEVKAQRLTRVFPDGRKEVVVETGGGPNGAAVGPDGAIWIANNGGAFFYPDQYQGGSIQRYDLTSGELTTVYEACDGVRLITPNDLVFDRQGGLWFSDHGRSTDEARLYGALYYARPDGSRISRQRRRLQSPNGVGLSPDETVVYLADTETGRLWALDVVEPGVLTPQERHLPGRLVAGLPGLQALDSLAVEASGKVCAATIGDSGITVFDPDGTTELVRAPDLMTTNICFGGPDMRDAWITGSMSGRLYKARWPRPGLKLNFNG
ncbi:SMP-30/gluconolactonase/LRE family protein [Phenylobacterium sp. LjRoot219]|uniref:SMP-30/gluconolactonase/LRE family protein n=1 Tax=Phenylobacterium sp. LjRoot219 TaxID=3342283 RepID=UPI003ECDB0A2